MTAFVPNQIYMLINGLTGISVDFSNHERASDKRCFDQSCQFPKIQDDQIQRSAIERYIWKLLKSVFGVPIRCDGGWSAPSNEFQLQTFVNNVHACRGTVGT
jgi:hypothetical protein